MILLCLPFKTYISDCLTLSLCGEASHSTYVREQDLRLIAKILNKEYRDLAAAKHTIPHIDNNNNVANSTSDSFVDTEPKCRDVKDWSTPCYCQWEMCIGWSVSNYLLINKIDQLFCPIVFLQLSTHHFQLTTRYHQLPTHIIPLLTQMGFYHGVLS